MGRTVGAALVLCLLSAPAVALTPPKPCEVVESGMRVADANAFGYAGSGFVSEEYSNALEREAGADNVFDRLPVPIAQLQEFYGYRVSDCGTGEFLAIGGVPENGSPQLLATEFLREKAQQEKPFTMANVTRAAQALYTGREDVTILTLRETEKTCACRTYGG